VTPKTAAALLQLHGYPSERAIQLVLEAQAGRRPADEELQLGRELDLDRSAQAERAALFESEEGLDGHPLLRDAQASEEPGRG
jgi:hypothetical protein